MTCPMRSRADALIDCVLCDISGVSSYQYRQLKTAAHASQCNGHKPIIFLGDLLPLANALILISRIEKRRLDSGQQILLFENNVWSWAYPGQAPRLLYQ